MAKRFMMKGNEAIAEAAIQAGCRHYFGYPITPQTEVAAYMSKKLPKIGGTFLQAESEVASINMVYGASAAGVRVMTSSSSPGISLMSEGLSYLACSNTPALVVNVQRCSPGLGGIMPSQADYFQATRGGGQGDYHLIVLAPASVQEMASLTAHGFNLADKYLVPAMLLADGTTGQMMEPVSFEEIKIEHYDKPWALTGTGMKRAKNVVTSLHLDSVEFERHIQDMFRRYELIAENEVMYEEYMMEDAEVCIAAHGIASRIARNAIVALRAEGIKAGLIRPITVWPFPVKPFRKAAEHCSAFVSVELSMGQMIEDVRLAIADSRPVSLCNRGGGLIPTPEEVISAVRAAVSAQKGE